MAIPKTFQSRGTRVFHGVAGGAISPCRFVGRSGGAIIACASAERPIGVSPDTYATSDDVDYHKQGYASIETDGSAAVDEYLKAASDGSGKGIKDSSPGFTTGARVLSLDATSNIAFCELLV
jgi:hypothetical protein